MRFSASIREAFAIAMRSLRSSKLRSFLTLLGIILATMTLISVMGVIHGMNRYIAEKVIDFGANGFMVVRMAFLGDFNPKKFLALQRKNPQLNREEYAFLKERATLLKDIGIRANTGAAVEYKNLREEGVSIVGGTANMITLANVQAVGGRYFSESEDRTHKSVAFIGHDVKEKFFANVDPVGKTLSIQGRPFEVIGYAKQIGSVFGESQDNYIHIPIETFFKMYGSRRWISFAAQARDYATFHQAQDEVRALLRAYRHVNPKDDDNFAIINQESIANAWERLTGVIAATAIAVVSVFMVVGGVVIMNIMLAVVTERTQEIGIRKSIGARRSDILQQFLIESAVLSGSGGLLGVFIAWVIALLVRNFTPVPMQLPYSAIVIGVGLSAAVGLFFGIYPARQAAKLDPIEALRAEK